MAVQVRRAPWLQPERWRRHPTWAVGLLLSGVVAAFSSLWVRGSVLLDGRGIALYARLSASYLAHLDRVPYWLPEMWAGSPVWALGPSLPLFLLVPVTTVSSADTAVKVAILVLQVLGGVGAYTLARSLWGKGPAPVVAGILYSLHPMVISHGALAGLEGLIGVTAATPWLAWSFRKGIRGEGTRYVVAAGLISAFAVLHQAEHALALPLMCVVMLVVELRRPRGDPDPDSDDPYAYEPYAYDPYAYDPRFAPGVRRPDPPGKILTRAAAAFGVGLAGAAFWLLPLVALRDAFVLSPPELVQAELTGGAAAQVSNEIGVFFDRPSPLSGAVSYYRTGLFPQFFYLGLVCAALTLVTLVFLCRRRRADERHMDDGHLMAILVASGLAMWFSTGSVPLIGSGPSLRHQVVPLALTGLGAGLLLGGFLRHTRPGRFKVPAVVAAAALLLAVPFVTPYLTLQKVVPLFAVIRFPRFYTLAALGVSLGAAYPVTVLGGWLRRRGDIRARLPVVAAVAVVALFLVDILPFRALYDVGPPSSANAYRQASAVLPAATRLSRVATGLLEPGAASALIDNGWLLSTGWPHPVAGKQLWRLTGETYPGPPGFREAALGLSATAYVAVEKWQDLGTAEETVTSVEFVRNARALPILRSYEQVVVVDDADLSPFLATGLAYRNVGVVTRGEPLGTLLDGMPNASVPSADPCARPSLADLNALSGEVAIACTVDPWLGGLLRGTELVSLGRRPGAVFDARANGLRGVSVWLERTVGEPDLALFEVGPDGRTLGPELARAQAVGTDEYGLTAFTFDPIADSAGRRFAFVLSCAGCPTQPRMIAGTAEPGKGDLIDGGTLRTDRIAAQTPIYDRVPPATPPATRLTATGRGPGSWTIQVDAPNPAMVVVAEAWFPGWKATVDGKSTPVVQADGAFLGVIMGAGQHVVEITYHRPVVADAGRLITFGTLIALAFVGWRRRGQGAPDDDRLVAADDWETAAARAPHPAPATRAAAPSSETADGRASAGQRPKRLPGRPGRPSPPPDPPTRGPG